MIGVVPDYQGKGCGGVLLQEFEQQAKADNVEYIRLSVKPSNKQAIKSYRRNGWSELKHDKNNITMKRKRRAQS